MERGIMGITGGAELLLSTVSTGFGYVSLVHQRYHADNLDFEPPKRGSLLQMMTSFSRGDFFPFPAKIGKHPGNDRCPLPRFWIFGEHQLLQNSSLPCRLLWSLVCYWHEVL